MAQLDCQYCPGCELCRPDWRFHAAEPHELDWPGGRPSDKGPQHLIVGLVSGFALGICTAVACGWWPL